MNNVVVIDDSTVVRKIVETSLRRVGVTCISYQDGMEALQAFKAGQSPIPDLIFLDIGLPKLSGYDILRLLRTSPQFDHTTVVMISARDGVLDRLKSRLAGARDYMIKPFKTQDLLSIVLSCLDQPLNDAYLS